jgi:hypothetical protein
MINNLRTSAHRAVAGTTWLVIATCICSDAKANGILPYMVVPLGQTFLLPIIIVIESVILWYLLTSRFLSALWQSFIANIVSTLVGVGLYLATMPFVGDHLFRWLLRGGFGSMAIRNRNAFIALTIAAILWAISVLVESIIIGRMNKLASWKEVSRQCAIANLVTYVFLIILAMYWKR